MHYKYNPAVDDLNNLNTILHGKHSDTVTIEFDSTPSNDVVKSLFEITEAYPNQVNLMLKGGISDYAFLKKLPQLAGLSLFLFGDFDFDYLKIFSNLKKLRLSLFTSKHISLGLYLPYIKNLDVFVASNTIKEKDLFSAFENLSSLFLSHNQFDFTIIDKLPLLKKLKLFQVKLINSNQIRVGNSSIQYISMGEVENITNLDFIREFYNVEFLDLYKLKMIKRLPSFEMNNKLFRISLEKINVENFFNLNTAVNLEELKIENSLKTNQDFTFLLDMNHLKLVDLSNCSDDLYQKLNNKGIDTSTQISKYMGDLKVMHDL